MSDLTSSHMQYLEQITQAGDLAEARRLCDSFLKITASMVPVYGPAQKPEELFAMLLAETPGADKTADKTLRELSGRGYESYTLMVLSLDSGGTDFKGATEQILKHHDVWCVPYQDYLVCVAASASGPVNITDFPQLLRKHGLSAGVSRPIDTLAMLRTAYEQAAATLKTIRTLQRNRVMAYYDDFLMIRLLDCIREDVDLSNFCFQDIRAIQDYDRKHDAELCRTLLCYLEHHRNASNTARELNIHRNTVHYRINKCMEILKGLDFSDDNVAFLLMLSLHIAEYDFYRTMQKQAMRIT